MFICFKAEGASGRGHTMAQSTVKGLKFWKMSHTSQKRIKNYGFRVEWEFSKFALNFFISDKIALASKVMPPPAPGLRNGAPLKERNKIKFHRSFRGGGGCMTQPRVENTRVHFWTFSPVSVKNDFQSWQILYIFLIQSFEASDAYWQLWRVSEIFPLR